MPRRRLVPIALWTLLGVLLLAGALLFHFSRPQRLTPILLSALGRETGLRIDAQGPARIVFRPLPRLHLRDVRARSEDGAALLFTIAEIDVAVPWRTALGAEMIEIESLHVAGLHLDLVAARTWWGARPSVVTDGTWPRFPHGLRIADSEIQATAWRLAIAALDISRLALNEALELRLDAQLRTDDAAAGTHNWPLHVQIQATPRRSDGALILTLDRIALAASPELPALSARGEAQIGTTSMLDLSGTLDAMPASWPGLPGFDLRRPLPFTLRASNTDAVLDVRLQLDQGDTHLRLQGDPQRLRTALARAQGSPLPAVEGNWRAASMQIDGVRLEGVDLKLEADAAQ